MLQSGTLQQGGVRGEVRRPLTIVIPAEAGIQTRRRLDHHQLSRLWIPAFAGMTGLAWRR